MKQDLIECINDIPRIESLFQQDAPVKGLLVPNSPYIYSNDEFIMWKSELAIELQDIVDKTEDQFIKSTLEIVNAEWNGWKDERMFQQLKGNLLGIYKRIDRYYPKETEQCINMCADNKPEIQNEREMKKKYQVFVSSTFEDLKEERLAVMDALLENDCIPIGMERFPAVPMEQMEYIKRLIDQCDYYVLVSAGAYGSIEEESGKSYTELEFEYAMTKGVPVLAFLHSDYDRLLSYKMSDKDKQDKLREFRTRIQQSGRLTKSFANRDQLKGEVGTSIRNTISMFPRTGWIRADGYEILQQKFTEAQEEIERLRESQPVFAIPINNAVKAGQELSHEAMILLAYASKDPNGQIMLLTTLSGTSLSTAGWDFIGNDTDARTIAIWTGVIDELDASGFIKLVGRKDKIYQVTRTGYNVAEVVISENEINISRNPSVYLEG